MQPYDYFVTATLLGGEPDINRRIINSGFDRVVCTFNYEMRPWTVKNQQELDACLTALRNLTN